jgi:hypothetical protein
MQWTSNFIKVSPSTPFTIAAYPARSGSSRLQTSHRILLQAIRIQIPGHCRLPILPEPHVILIRISGIIASLSTQTSVVTGLGALMEVHLAHSRLEFLVWSLVLITSETIQMPCPKLIG